MAIFRKTGFKKRGNKFVVATMMVFLAFVPATGVCGQKTRIKHLYSITGSEETGPLGLIGSVFFDENKGRLYVTDSSNHRILAYDSDFKFVSEFSGGGGLDSPTSLVKDSRGRFFVAQPTTGQVLVIDMVEKRMVPVDFSAVPQANAFSPGNMAVDSQDRLYVVDKANERIVVFGPELNFEKQIRVNSGQGLSDVDVDGAGRVYALNTLDGSIQVFDHDGKRLGGFGKKGSARDAFQFPVSLAIDGKGRIFVVDQHKSAILVFDKRGEFLYVFSQLGWREGRLHFPSHVFVNHAGKIFVVDRQNARVSVFE